MSIQDMEGLPQPTAASLEAENSIASCSGDDSLFAKHYPDAYMEDGASTSLSNSIEEPESIISHCVRLKDDKSKEHNDMVAVNNELSAVSSENKDKRLVEGESAGSEDLPLEDHVAQDLQDQDDELRALGINVVDQLSLERNVEAAVDKAVTMHTRRQKFQILKKETHDIKKEIKQAENKLQNLKNRRSGMQQRVVDPRMFFKVEEDIKSKAQQLQMLRSRETLMQQKLTCAESNEEELDNFDLEEGEIAEEEDESQGEGVMSESERERLIREGQMTPFGTISTASKTVSFPRPPETYVKKPVPTGRTKTATGNVLSKEEMISSGEMTPFGTIMKTADTATRISKGSTDTAGGMSDFEKYLQDQISRQQQHSKSGKGTQRKKSSNDSIYGVPKKRPKKLKEYVGNSDYENLGSGDDGSKSSSVSSVKKKAKGNNKRKAKSQGKSPLKKNILCPKKKKAKVELGTVVSTSESDQLKCPPRRLLSERVSLEESDHEGYCDQGSDDEYVPSDPESLDLKDEGEDDSEGERLTLAERRGDYMKVKREKSKKIKKEESEGELSADDVPRVKKKKMKSRDDGNLNGYVKRIETWKKERLKKKHEKILRGEDFDSEEEEEEGYEQFIGGYKVPLLIWNKLYKYQRTCVRWLWELHSQGCGGILGDEMGLGKTIQIISFLVGLSYSRLTYRRQQWQGLGPVLVVCPATVLHQWVKEFHKWWPPFRVAVMHESGSFTGKKPALINNINSYCGILVTSYTGVRDQLETLLQYDWHYIILDEGHKIRNPEAQITVALKRFQTPHRLILSGSPIQNNLKELWSLFDFVFPGKLGTLPVFLQQFAVPITQGGYSNATKLEVQTAFKCASMLRDTINPFLLRRMKHDVRSHLTLPDKNEQVLFCDLSEEQRKVYVEYISGRQVEAIMGGRAKVFVGLINLRKICNHPDLFTGGPHGLDDAWDSGLQPELKYGWWARSGKMHVLHSILALWHRQGHRVLLFTQSRQMMCILEKFLLEEQYSYLKMDGTTTVSSRQPMIDKFNNDPTYFVFLLTTRVGGLGVNLTGADRVVIFDPDWNPSTDSQARERAWRIGQLRHVTIYRLLTAGTIEEKIYHRQIFKQFLTNRVLKDPKQQRFFKTNDLYELFSLTEGEKEKTESSAIFAGTGSEIKLGVKKKECGEQGTFSAKGSGGAGVGVQQNAGITKKQVSIKSHLNKSPLQREKGKRDKLVCKPIDKKEKENSPVISTSQVEKMKELAKLLSQKIGNKKKSQEETEASTQVKGEEEDKGTNNDNRIGSDILDNPCVGKFQEEVDVKIEIKEEPIDVEVNLVDTKEIVAGELSAVNEPLSTAREKDAETNQVETETGDGDMNVEEEDAQNSEGKENILYKLLSQGNDSKHDKKRVDTGRQSDTIKENGDEKLPEQVIKHKIAHKKKDKERSREKNSDRHRKRGKKFEGERVAYLVKRRTYQKTEEEEKAERENSKSQDQYVLEKLFRKSGVHTALSHDAIMNNSDPDYLLMEGEAERVAKEALKAVRASRSRCFRPQFADATSKLPGKSTPKFGKKKNLVFADAISGRDSEVKERSRKEKKVHMFNGGMEEEEEEEKEGDKNNNEKSECEGNKAVTTVKIGQESAGGSSGMLSSSQLLLRMKQRNKGLALDSDDDEEEEGYDPDYPSTAPVEAEIVEPEVQENIDLLADIRNFVAFQAEVDGQATTQEIIARFQQRLPPSQTPFFKALLTQICDFHRDTTGKGIWSLKGEFR